MPNFKDIQKFFEGTKDLPKFKQILTDPENTWIPTNNTCNSVLLAGLLATEPELSSNNITKIIIYVKRLPMESQIAFTMLTSKHRRDLLNPGGLPKTPLEELASEIISHVESNA